MSEFYEYDSSCTRCLRSSSLSGLLALIIVFLGGTAFGVGTIYGRRRLCELLVADFMFPFMEYTVYAIVGATGLFVIVAYIICAVSSGWNAKRCFEGSRATSCGRCLNSSLLVLLLLAVVFWTLVTCLLCYPVMSGGLLLYRDAGPARSLNNPDAGLLRIARHDNPVFMPVTKQDDGATAHALKNGGLDVDPSEVIANYFSCEPDKVDLSYYGLYTSDGKPFLLNSAELNKRLREPLIFVCIAFLGALIIMLGFLLLVCTVAMNYARLKELRYYDTSDTGDETIRLRN